MKINKITYKLQRAKWKNKTTNDERTNTPRKSATQNTLGMNDSGNKK